MLPIEVPGTNIGQSVSVELHPLLSRKADANPLAPSPMCCWISLKQIAIVEHIHRLTRSEHNEL